MKDETREKLYKTCTDVAMISSTAGVTAMGGWLIYAFAVNPIKEAIKNWRAKKKAEKQMQDVKPTESNDVFDFEKLPDQEEP